MKKKFGTAGRLVAVAVAAAAVSVALAPVAASASTPTTTSDQAHVSPTGAADGTAKGAVAWYKGNLGSSAYQGMCEKAAENAYGTTGVWASAIAHWEGSKRAGKAHAGDKKPPLGAFVYWNISNYGHVGIADGNGGIYASSMNGAIGHADSVDYFANYLGWSDPQVPQGVMPEGVQQH